MLLDLTDLRELANEFKARAQSCEDLGRGLSDSHPYKLRLTSKASAYLHCCQMTLELIKRQRG